MNNLDHFIKITNTESYESERTKLAQRILSFYSVKTKENETIEKIEREQESNIIIQYPIVNTYKNINYMKEKDGIIQLLKQLIP